MVQVAQRNLLVACMRVAGDLKLCRVVAKVVSCPALPLHNYHLSSPRRRSSHPLGGWRPASGGSSRPSSRWRHYLWCGSGFCVRILSVYQDSFAVSGFLLPYQDPFDRIRILLPYQDPFAVSWSFCVVRIRLSNEDSIVKSRSLWSKKILALRQDPVV